MIFCLKTERLSDSIKVHTSILSDKEKALMSVAKLEPLFVLATDTKDNFVYVGQGHNHPGAQPLRSFYTCQRYSLDSGRFANAAG